MKFGISKPMKTTLLGGIAGALTFFGEECAYEFVAGYPQALADRLDPSLPRNGTLLAAGAPLAAAWVLPKVMKRHSQNVETVKMGITLYSAPKLLHQIVVNMAYQAGTTVTGGLRRAALPLRVSPANNNQMRIGPMLVPQRTVTASSSGSKYVMTS